jgi:hypothetical protein
MPPQGQLAQAATMLKASSGSDVPSATMVSPTTRSLMPRALARPIRAPIATQAR